MSAGNWGEVQSLCPHAELLNQSQHFNAIAPETHKHTRVFCWRAFPEGSPCCWSCFQEGAPYPPPASPLSARSHCTIPPPPLLFCPRDSLPRPHQAAQPKVEQQRLS